jgi:hypothetical protein
MSQSTRRWISEKIKSLQEADVLPFHEILGADAVEIAPGYGNDSRQNRWRLMWGIWWPKGRFLAR